MAGKWFDPSGRTWTALIGLTLLVLAASPGRVRAQNDTIDLDLSLKGEDDKKQDTDNKNVNLDLSLDQDQQKQPDNNAPKTTDNSSLLILPPQPAEQPPADTTTPETIAPAAGDQASAQKLDSDFKDFLQQASQGNFKQADISARNLLDNPLVSPKLSPEGADRLIDLTQQDNNLQTLKSLTGKAEIKENAAKVMNRVREAYNLRLELDFKDYLMYAVMGEFEKADAFAQSLLQNPLLSPELTPQGADQLVALTQKYNKSLETLQILVNKAKIGDNAARVMRLIEESYRLQRMKPERILANIALLNGTPMERKVALDRLVESGEYAVPWMLETLEDASKKELHPFVIRALPKLGNRAVNALIVGLQDDDPNIRAIVATALGKIGYPRALPYLQMHATNPDENVSVRNAAAEAVQMIVVSDPSVRELPANELFANLAELYYANADTLRPDPREDRANVWFMRDGVLVPTEVPRDIFRFVMCMRTAENVLKLAPSRTDMAALWLAADLKREATLGLDVESAEPAKDSLDLTRPENFPRAVYFARALGPAVDQLVLHRAVNDLDRQVALGVIAGLQDNAGPAALVQPAEPRGLSLASALDFPDLYVRIRAALALGRALPPMMFRGAENVVPVLASALNLKGDRFYLVVEPDEASRRVLVNGLSSSGATVIAAPNLTQALDEAHRRFMHLDGIFLASNMNTPSVIDGIRQLNQDTRFSLAPIVVLVKAGDAIKIDQIHQIDPRVGIVLNPSEGDTVDESIVSPLLDERDEAAKEYQHQTITPELGLELALASARTLRLIAESNVTPFDTRLAQQDLIRALTYDNEELRIAAGKALALIDAPAAQQAIATLALDPSQTESLRMAMFSSLAESARRFGPRLQDDQVKELSSQGINDPNLTLRTAASKALGAMNFPTDVASKVILAQPKP